MSEKIALVTGAGSGIGLACASALARAGWRIVLTGRRRDVLEAAAASIDADGASTLIHPADVGDPAQVDALFAAVKARFGRLDLLFNNAGTGAGGKIEDVAFDKWREVVSVNLTGSFLCLQAAFRLMKDQEPQGGRIINNGSISAHTPRPYTVAYAATKHAITGLTKAAALEGRAYDIACGQIDIGNARSAMTSPMMTGMPQASGAVAAEPVMDVERVAEAVLYMAGLPLDANVLSGDWSWRPRCPFVGRGIGSVIAHARSGSEGVEEASLPRQISPSNDSLHPGIPDGLSPLQQPILHPPGRVKPEAVRSRAAFPASRPRSSKPRRIIF